MKCFPFFVFSFVFILIFVVLAIAQIEKDQDNCAGKIAIINNKTFRNKDTGIKKVSDAYDKVENELKLQYEELRLLAKELKKKEDELKDLSGKGGPTIEEINARIKQYEIAASNFKSKQEKVKSLYEKRIFELTADINKRISEAASLFAKEKGYLFILDTSKLDESFILTKSENADVTEEFIKYYKRNFVKAKVQ